MTASMQASPSLLIQSLDAAINSLLDAQHLYLLVDPALHDPIATMAEAAALPKQSIPIQAIPLNRRPYLLDLHSVARNEKVLNNSLRLGLEEGLGAYDLPDGSPRSLCAWIDAPGQKINDLAAALARRTALSMAGVQAVSFRYWDPRITVHLPRLLGKAVMTDLLADLGATAWWAFATQANGAQHLTSLGQSEPARTLVDEAAHQWALDGTQWRALTALGWANRLARLVPDWGLEAQPDQGTLEHVATQALAWGLASESDVLRFAYFALTYHPQFDTHPKVRTALEAARANEQTSFAEITQAWDESFKEELRKGVGPTRATVH
ncbi:hypothetical protein [Chitinimonas sp. BJB300]|uniref:hypothetical protein n=1 Tax=Chitinimonas sp. BJB300 TaxID=1559339 RepID=UPI000C1203BF|nr:hypothetical protein [Chitinimonas sp. BJB300]PHV10533.1 hypothetical protein CSQ89_15725 [Chitinimonas sp. BJB300]TSJ85227.1 hypothetical protein FG002_018175 [Chitinimonas sp. BJB300]